MKSTFALSILISFFLLLNSCKEDKPTLPVLSTNEITGITAISAISGGKISSDGGSAITASGVCWSTGIEPTTDDNKTNDVAVTNVFTSNITGLDGGTLYYARAYATNIAGTGYGKAMSFTTLGQAPTASTGVATNISTQSATLNGTANANYITTDVAFEYGTTASYGSTKSATQSPIIGSVNTTISADLFGLTPGTTYHFRIKTTNTRGTIFGSDMIFTTIGQAPTASTQAATNITTSSATLNGAVNANYLSTLVTFEYGATTSYGSTISATPSPLTGSSMTSVSANLTGLPVGTIYHFRIKSENALGITNGSDLVFSTLGQAPSVTTLTVTNVTTTSVTINGLVNPNNLLTTVTFEWGTTTAYGNTIIATQSPVNGGSPINVNSPITGLLPGTTAHFRIKAENLKGTVYGSDVIFTTLGQVPSITTQAATNLTTTSVTLNGLVNPNNLNTTITFEWGTTASFGNSTNATQSPISGGSPLNVNVVLSGLIKGTTYYARIYASNSMGAVYGDEMTITTATVSVGESYQGGIVAYTLQPTDPGYIAGETHGLIAAPSDQGMPVWGCYQADIPGADGTAIGTGKQNTLDIVNGCATTGIAAKICNDLVLNGYDDWYLPSKDELNELFKKRDIIGGFANSTYWSSSDYNSSFAWYQIFDPYGGLNGNQYYGIKSLGWYVRAIRSF
jgi:phosphodiesterase/alkaline phosphatase D-like protein